jgi:putative tryptophan/tyrosine transport system substrate-binding protein
VLDNALTTRCELKKVGWSSILVAVALLNFAVITEAQQPGKIPWVGYLAGSGSSPNQAFVQGMRDLGYTEGKNIGFVYRTTEGKRESYADFVAELVRLKVDVIVTDSTDAALLAKKTTSSIPIVMTRGTDPVGAGLVTSLARPGGNVTGLTSVTGELAGKLLELLKETKPKLTRAAILRPEGRADDLFVKEAEVPGRALGVQLVPVVVQGPDDIEGVFRGMSKERVNGLVMRLPASGYSTHYKRVAELTIKNRLPAISTSATWVDAGGLMSYGPDFSIGYRRAATYVDKILKGAKPADLPVEAPTKFEWIINAKTAKQIGLTIPQKVLARADKVIK